LSDGSAIYWEAELRCLINGRCPGLIPIQPGSFIIRLAKCKLGLEAAFQYLECEGKGRGIPELMKLF
jgi:hypothetical protein